jgi:uncharacterized protein (TIGR00369 family)
VLAQSRKPKGVVILNNETNLGDRDKKREWARLNPACIACGSANPKGLQIDFQEQEPGTICAQWIPSSDWESFKGTIHGGIIATVLDEAMSKAIIALHWEAMTVDMRVRFRARVSPGEALRGRGWVTDQRRRKISAEATIVNAAGEECAHAWATFLVPRSKSIVAVT